jgi:sec-independent protein translocase protein TatC
MTGLSDTDPELQGSGDDLPRMSLMEHLEELRTRIFRSLIAVSVTFVFCWLFVEEIADFLAQPIYEALPEGTRLTFLGVTDPFVMYVKVAALAALFLASPLVLYQAWRFVAPGLYQKEKRHALPFILAGSFFFIAGGAFAYYVAFPFAVDFLIGMGEAFQPMITVEKYFRFLLYVILGLGLMFELPIVIFLLAQMGVVTPKFLIRHFRWAVLLIFVAAALITPTPDVVNLLLFALPTILLYLLGVAAAALVVRTKDASEDDD